MNINIGTRKSPLALAQANEVKKSLMAAMPGLEVELVEMITSGDQFMQSLTDVGGKGLFTKEIEDALLAKSIDLAVHSMKDMPTILPDGLIIGGMPPREDVRDVLLGKNIHSIGDIPKGAVFGTSALRRSAQMLMVRPDLQIVTFRGNVQTRLKKLEEGVVVATMLAKAGLKRLGLDIPGVELPIDVFLPAVAQGAIGIECRDDDDKMKELLSRISHKPTEMAVNCERAFLRELDGSCRTPIAGYAQIQNEKIHFRGLVIKPDGSAHHAVEMSGEINDSIQLGKAAGKKIAQAMGPGFLGK
jgi:hydroxymethylbilane synthase